MGSIAAEIRDWITEQLRGEIAKIDRLHPRLGLMATCY